MAVIPTRIEPSVAPRRASPRRLEAELRELLATGKKLHPVGEAARKPSTLLTRYPPKYSLELFGTRVYLSTLLQNPTLRFFVAYVAPPKSRRIHPRIFYKDVSLIWRCASHMILEEHDEWIGKGDVVSFVEDGYEIADSLESTTDLPYEMQTALEIVSRKRRTIPFDETVLRLVLRRSPSGRIRAYRDFVAPRQRAAADRRNLIHGGRDVAWFARKEDPKSLRFAKGFEPDFKGGVIEVSESRSSLYGGDVARFRILSRNRSIQYLFFAGAHQVWIIPAQALTTELSSFAVRTIDVMAHEDLFVPGFEYHYLDETQDPPALVSQIPGGFAGENSEHEPDRADASPWIDRLPIVREFRRKVLAPHRRGARASRVKKR